MKINFFSKLLLCTGAALLLSSCDIDDDNNNYYNPIDQTIARGVIANVSPNSGDLYFYADANLVNNSPLGYNTAEGYYGFFTGNRVLSVKNTAGNIVASDTISLAAGQYFSAFAVNTFDNIELVTYTDSLDYPAANRARVRFINLSPDAGGITITAPNLTFATNLGFKESTSFDEVESGNYTITFTSTATGEVLFTTTATELNNGGNYTIYTKGFVTPPAGSNDTFSSEKLRNY